MQANAVICVAEQYRVAKARELLEGSRASPIATAASMVAPHSDPGEDSQSEH